MNASNLVIGIDGGGSHTVAWLALAETPQGSVPLGEGRSGGCNPQSVDWELARENLSLAVDGAFRAAGVRPTTVSAACLALAGGDRELPQRQITCWADERRLARRLRLVNDAVPVLAAGSPKGAGVALIAGTGSIAFGRDAQGRTARAGGWGYLLGDEGSGYSIAMSGLRYAAKSIDGRCAATQLADLFLQELELVDSSELITAVYRRSSDRAWIASLAHVVFAAAQHDDAVALQIIAKAGHDLAQMVAAVVRKLDLQRDPYPLAVAGGILVRRPLLREYVQTSLRRLKCEPTTRAIVVKPVRGAVILAQECRRTDACRAPREP